MHRRHRVVARWCAGRLARHRCPGRRPGGKLRQAPLRREGFRPAHPRPWRPARPAGRAAGRCAGCGTAGVDRGTWSSAVGMNESRRAPSPSWAAPAASAPRPCSCWPPRPSASASGRWSAAATSQLLAEQAIAPGRRAGGHRRCRLPCRAARGAGRHRRAGRGRRRSGGRGRRAGGRLDHGGDHRRRRPGADAGRDPPRQVRRAGQQGGAGLRRRGDAARGARGRRHAAAGRFRAQRDLPVAWPTATAARSSRSC